jgi:sporulation protein YlmC with PRC-barrel domain
MEIPLNAQVECTDGVCGRAVYVLINPILDEVTHLVVREDSSLTEYIVPVDVVTQTIAGTILIRCSKAELEKMDPFVTTTVIEEKVPNRYYANGEGVYRMGSYYYMPLVTPEIKVHVPVKQRQIPLGELAVRRGTRMKATDGYIGRVDEFVVNPENGHITHLVMREGHLWGQKDVIIPLSAIRDIDEDTVFLNLDKHQIESLPAFPLHRGWS